MKPGINFRVFASGLAALALAATGSLALAQDDEEELEEIIVKGSLRSLPTQDVGSVFGFDKNVLETPRSVSTVSSEQIERFGIDDIDELVTFAPGTFTQSFFGVAGGLDVRGTPGETYFRGVRRLDNPGNYPTPIGASDRIDVVRGPATPIYGPSKIGGYLNFVPKSARADTGQYLDEPEGALSYTLGSWDKNVLTAEVGGPGSLGGRDFGYYVYGMAEDSGSYYENTETRQALAQASFDVDVSDNLRFMFGGMLHNYEGNQVAGWNRLTQDLVDTGTYITGDSQPLDTDGDGSISHQEYFAVFIAPFVFRPEFVTPGDLTPEMALVNAGTAQLNGSQVLVAPDDTLESDVKTLYFDFIYSTNSGWEFKNQLFFEDYDTLSENAYGFSQFGEATVWEEKFIISKVFESGRGLTTSLQLSPSYRYTEFEHGDDYTNEFFDRRDITGPSTALDRRLLSTRINGDYTEYDVGDYSDLGIGFMVDFNFENGLDILLGARYDSVDFTGHIPVDKLLLGNFTSGFVIQSTDGLYLLNDFVDPDNYTADDIAAPVDISDTEDGVSWTASVSWAIGGFVPYVTMSEQSTVIAGQGANIANASVFTNGWFDTSELMEYGIKTSFLDDTLYMALSVYDQERTDFNAQAIVTNQTSRTEGIEFETRWAATERLLLTFGYSKMEVTNLNTLVNGGRFSFYGADDMPQIDPTLVYGGQVIGIPADTPGLEGRRTGVPEDVFTFTGTYAFDNGFAFNVSVVDVDSVASGHSRAVILPAYTLVNVGAVYETERWLFNVIAKNVTDERYFRANFPDLFGSQIVLPERPASVQATFAFRF
ncbi:MAG: TonB-dependent receptor [Gammaproteobacteria bacterium]|nr:TonB-dependent receptor [Gammaproteobacteria bacterium]